MGACLIHCRPPFVAICCKEWGVPLPRRALACYTDMCSLLLVPVTAFLDSSLSEANLAQIAERLLAISGGVGSKGCFDTPFGTCCISAQTNSRGTPVASAEAITLADVLKDMLLKYQTIARSEFPEGFKFTSSVTTTLPPVRGFLEDGACDLIIYIEW